jgi:hypothetical protein
MRRHDRCLVCIHGLQQDLWKRLGRKVSWARANSKYHTRMFLCWVAIVANASSCISSSFSSSYQQQHSRAKCRPSDPQTRRSRKLHCSHQGWWQLEESCHWDRLRKGRYSVTTLAGLGKVFRRPPLTYPLQPTQPITSAVTWTCILITCCII